MNNESNKRKEDESSIVPTSRNKRLRTLVKPKRVKKITETVNELEHLQKDMENIANTNLQEKEYYECTACAEKLYPPYPPRVKRLIKAVRQNEINYRKEQEDQHKALVEECKKNGQPAPIFNYIKGGISMNDKAVICRMHKVELVYNPLAIERGYPTNINFGEIPERVKEMESELKEIIDRKKESQFLEKVLEVHKELGSEKARRTTVLINRFDEYLPGYYGNRGSHFIMEAVQNMFVKTEILNKENASPLTQVEFAQQVLVPEVGSRLIKQDQKLNSLKEAVKIMEESTEYGSIVYNKVKKVKEE
ncbi:unnamed protein product [Mucor hiemalis]